MYDKLLLIFFAFGLSRVANCVQELIQKKQEDIDKEIRNRICPPLSSKKKRRRRVVISKEKINSDENLKILDKQKRSIERIVVWEILFWILFFLYYFFNLETKI